MANIELIIFDCDGVLIDSEHLAIASEVSALRDHGFDVAYEDFVERYLGLSDEAVSADLKERFGLTLPDDFRQIAGQRIAETFKRDLKEMSGIRQVLEAIPCQICIGSGSNPERLKHSLSLVGLYDVFAPNIFSAAQVARGKPEPDLFLLAAKTMNVPPFRCLVIEDGIAGVKAAVAAGMRVIGFTGGSHCAPDYSERLQAFGTEKIFRAMDQVAHFLKSEFDPAEESISRREGANLDRQLA